jgi:hypothetical protein
MGRDKVPGAAANQKGPIMNRRNFLQTAGIGSTAFAFTASAQAGGNEGKGKSAPDGQRTAFEFLARSDQDGPNVAHYGYLTHVFGLGDELLFADSNVRTEATARLTFLAATTLESRHEHGNIITTSAPGEMTLFFNQNPLGDFNQAESFAAGQPVASYSTRYYNVLNVQAPNQGITNAAVELTQIKAASFALGPHRLRLGRPNLRLRLLATGQGTRTQVDPLQAFFLVGGSAIVIDG